MSWTPTERVREAAFDAWQNTSASLSVRERLDAVLVAVGPMVAAQAQREAAESMREYIGRDASTPYTQGWNRALEVVSDQTEKEAGR